MNLSPYKKWTLVNTTSSTLDFSCMFFGLQNYKCDDCHVEHPRHTRRKVKSVSSMKSPRIEYSETPDYVPVKRRRNFPYPPSTRDNNLAREHSHKEKGSSLLFKSLEQNRNSPISTNSQKIAETEATLLKSILVIY